MELMNYPLSRIKSVYHSQRERCESKRNKSYKNYGAKGVRVKYSLAEFRSWFLKEIKTFKGTRPSVGRIDHDGNYEFGNIRIESVHDNARERMNRANPSKKKARWVRVEKLNGEVIGVVRTTREAAKLAGMSKSGVHYQCLPHHKPSENKRKSDYRFSYVRSPI
jgi:hypothetical protein